MDRSRGGPLGRSKQIRLLPDHLINQIAAGEVIERPASVVKELLDNSLDAGATRIEIDIEKAGVGLIRVRDNGQGIHPDDLQLALTRHATSKIRSMEDLNQILTLGFRGEALPSIASISRTTIMSSYGDEAHAWMVKTEGRSEVLSIEPVSHPEGTTVEVRDLFFNVPARRKFLRRERTEFYQIQQLLRHYAISHPQITFRLSHNGRQVLQVKAATQSDQLGETDSRVSAICGNRFIQSALRIDQQTAGLHLRGWLGKPEVAKTINDSQFFSLNGRFLRDRRVNHAIQQALQDRLPPGRHAVYVLDLRLDPALLDVNVHPAKTEVRFRQGREVHDFIYSSLHQAMTTTSFGLSDLRQLQTSTTYKGMPLSRKSAAPHFQVAQTQANYRAEVVDLDQARNEYAQQTAPMLQESNRAPAQRLDWTVVDQGDDCFYRRLGNVLIVANDEQIFFIDRPKFLRHQCTEQLQREWQQGQVRTRAILFPHRLRIDQAAQETLRKQRKFLNKLGIVIAQNKNQDGFLQQLPDCVCIHDLDRFIHDLLARLREKEALEAIMELMAKHPADQEPLDRDELQKQIKNQTVDGLLISLSETDLLKLIYDTK